MSNTEYLWQQLLLAEDQYAQAQDKDMIETWGLRVDVLLEALANLSTSD